MDQDNDINYLYQDKDINYQQNYFNDGWTKIKI
jgi:hypothetical protein